MSGSTGRSPSDRRPAIRSPFTSSYRRWRPSRWVSPSPFGPCSRWRRSRPCRTCSRGYRVQTFASSSWPGSSVLPFFIDALVLGQSDPINLFLVAAGLLLASKNRGMAGAWLIGLAGLVKFLPLAHWGTLLSRQRSWNVWLGMVLSVATGLGLLVAVVGTSGAHDGIRQQIAYLRGRHSPLGIIERGADLRPNNESIPMVLVRLCGDLPQEFERLAPIRLPRQSVRAIFGLWYGTVGLLAAGWLAAALRASGQPPERGWLAMFALSSILMLVSTPICWNHYFLWTLPAALFLRHRPRLLGTLAAANLGVTLSSGRTCPGRPHDDRDRPLWARSDRPGKHRESPAEVVRRMPVKRPRTFRGTDRGSPAGRAARCCRRGRRAGRRWEETRRGRRRA